MRAIRDRLGLFCDQLSGWPTLARTIRDGGGGSALDDLLALLNGVAEPDAARVLELLGAIDDACARRGLVGLTSREPGTGVLPPGMVTVETSAWVCPRGRCDRVVLPDESAAPVCSATGGAPMTRFTIPSR